MGNCTTKATKGGNLRSVLIIVKILGKGGHRELGFSIPRAKLMAQQAIMLNRVEEELPSVSDVAKADNIELQDIMENPVRSTEDLITWLDDSPGDSLEYLCRELLGLDKELRRIRVQ